MSRLIRRPVMVRPSCPFLVRREGGVGPRVSPNSDSVESRAVARQVDCARLYAEWGIG